MFKSFINYTPEYRDTKGNVFLVVLTKHPFTKLYALRLNNPIEASAARKKLVKFSLTASPESRLLNGELKEFGTLTILRMGFLKYLKFAAALSVGWPLILILVSLLVIAQVKLNSSESLLLMLLHMPWIVFLVWAKATPLPQPEILEPLPSTK